MQVQGGKGAGAGRQRQPEVAEADTDRYGVMAQRVMIITALSQQTVIQP